MNENTNDNANDTIIDTAAEILALRLALESANKFADLATAAAQEQHDRAEAWKGIAERNGRSDAASLDDLKQTMIGYNAMRAELVEVTAQRDMLVGAMREFFSSVEGEPYAHMQGDGVQKLRDALDAMDENDDDETQTKTISETHCPECGYPAFIDENGVLCCGYFHV